MRTMTGVGDSATSGLPATTACAAAAPESKGRTSTSTPCFLKKPSSLATYTTTLPKTGGTPGTANESFCSAPAAGRTPDNAKAHAAAKSIRHTVLRRSEEHTSELQSHS